MATRHILSTLDSSFSNAMVDPAKDTSPLASKPSMAKQQDGVASAAAGGLLCLKATKERLDAAKHELSMVKIQLHTLGKDQSPSTDTSSRVKQYLSRLNVLDAPASLWEEAKMIDVLHSVSKNPHYADDKAICDEILGKIKALLDSTSSNGAPVCPPVNPEKLKTTSIQTKVVLPESSEAEHTKGSTHATRAASSGGGGGEVPIFYYFLDNEKKEQGPFLKSQIVQWYDSNWFNNETLLKGNQDESWSPFKSFTELMASVNLKVYNSGVDIDPTLSDTKEPAGKQKQISQRLQKKRPVGSASVSVKQVKDSVVRGQFDSFAKKAASVQAMTLYKTEKQTDNNPAFLPLVVVFDEISPRPDDLMDGERERDLPLFTCMAPKGKDAKTIGASLEMLGKAMQQGKSKYHRNTKRSFDWELMDDPQKLCLALYGEKKQRKKKADEASKVDVDEEETEVEEEE